MQDPVCGMTVEPGTAAGAWEYRDQVYFFCSPGCLASFKADPKHYVDLDHSERGMA